MVADIALMDSKKKVTISWSGGKDSAFALYKIMVSGEYEVVHLHTVINAETKRVGLHGVGEKLIEAQAKGLGLKLVKLYLPPTEDHDAYTKLMENFYHQCASAKIDAVVFGDIFLEDLKIFRERMLTTYGLEGIFPIWGIDSARLVEDFLNVGFKTLLCSADKKYFKADSLGKTIDQEFLRSLSAKVDPAGENGEFHTFVYDGPVFNNPIHLKQGEVVEKNYSYKMTMENGEVTTVESIFLFKDLTID